MRIESSVLSVSWIPSEAVTGLPKQVFEAGVTHYDEPPPDHITPADLDELRAAARFRFANDLQAWIEVHDGKIVDCGYAGSGHMGLTTVSVVGKSATFEPVALPDLQHEPEVHGSAAKFVQTAGGRAPLPAPRTVKHPPFFQLKPPDVWTTLELTIHADGTSTFEVAGREQVPAPLGLRLDRRARSEGRARRLRRLVPHAVREAHPVGSTRTRRRTSPPSRRHSSASCRPRSCGAAPSPRSAR